MYRGSIHGYVMFLKLANEYDSVCHDQHNQKCLHCEGDREEYGTGAEVTAVSSFNTDPVYYLGSRLCATYVICLALVNDT